MGLKLSKAGNLLQQFRYLLLAKNVRVDQGIFVIMIITRSQTHGGSLLYRAYIIFSKRTHNHRLARSCSIRWGHRPQESV